MYSVTRAKRTRCYSPTSFQTIFLLLKCDPFISLRFVFINTFLQIQHPDYARRLETLPDYRNSLHTRYPPVCDECLPAVEEEIRLKDHMARTKALGGWLKQSKGKEKERKVSKSGKRRENLGVQLAAWKVRGCLWAITLLLIVAGNATGMVSIIISDRVTDRLAFQLPLVILCLLKWHICDHFFRQSL